MTRSTLRLRWAALPVAIAAVVAATATTGTAAGPLTASQAATATATTPAPASSPPTGAVRVGAIPADATGTRISVDGDVAAWSATSADGSAVWVSAAGQVQRYPTTSPPLGLSVSHIDGQAPVVLFSLCPPGKDASRARVGSCDLYRLSSLDAGGAVVPLATVGGDSQVGDASTERDDELAPSLTGRYLVFARWPKGPKPGYAVRRHVFTGHERRLPQGPLGVCKKHQRACSRDQRTTAGPVEISTSGANVAQLWTFFGGSESFGVDSTYQVLVGKRSGRGRLRITAESGVDGAGYATAIGSLQLIDGATQLAWNQYDPDDPSAAPGTHDDVLRSLGGGGYTYDDPAGRRIVSVAATPTELWLILDASALPAGTRDDAVPGYCSAPVGGCVVEHLPLPEFRRLKD